MCGRAAFAVLVTLAFVLGGGHPAGALPIGPPGGGGSGCTTNPECDDGDPCTVGERCVDGACLAPTDDICATTSTSSTSSTSTSSTSPASASSSTSTSTTSTAPAIQPTTSTTSITAATTSTTLASSLCAPGDACDDGDPCTEDACVAAICVQTPATGLPAAICVCERALPATCPSRMPRAVAKPLVRACALARTAYAQGAAAKRKVFVRAARKFEALGTRAAKLEAKGVLPAECAERLSGDAQQAQQAVTTALQAP